MPVGIIRVSIGGFCIFAHFVQVKRNEYLCLSAGVFPKQYSG